MLVAVVLPVTVELVTVVLLGTAVLVMVVLLGAVVLATVVLPKTPYWSQRCCSLPLCWSR